MTGTGDGDRLLRSNVTVALGTGLSRLTGFIRIAALGSVLGQQSLTDTYNFANNTPNVVYDLLLGGVLTASLVPLFVQHDEHDDDDATSAVISVAVLALVALTVVAVVAAPLIVRLYTVRVNTDQAMVRSVGTRFARLFLPQIFFYGLVALATAMLNAKRRFRGSAFAPVLNNVLVIGVILLLPRVIEGKIDLANASHNRSLVVILGLGTTAGIAVTAFAMLPLLRRAGIVLRWSPRFHHPAVKRIMRLSGWTFGYVAANQLAFLLVTILALGRNNGDLSAYIFAFTFFVLPHGLLAVSLMTTFAPELASAANRGDMAGFRSQMNLGLRALGLLVIPASAGYVVLSRALVSAGIRRHNLSAQDAFLTGRVLTALAVGLFGFSAYLFVLRGFYALGDAKTPFVLNLGENAVNVILAVAFVHRWGVVGLAASFAIAYNVSAILAYVVLVRQVGNLHGRRLSVTLGRYVLGSVVMALVVKFTVADLDNFRLASVTGVVIGTIVYVAVVVATEPLGRSLLKPRSPHHH